MFFSFKKYPLKAVTVAVLSTSCRYSAHISEAASALRLSSGISHCFLYFFKKKYSPVANDCCWILREGVGEGQSRCLLAPGPPSAPEADLRFSSRGPPPLPSAPHSCSRGFAILSSAPPVQNCVGLGLAESAAAPLLSTCTSVERSAPPHFCI